MRDLNPSLVSQSGDPVVTDPTQYRMESSQNTLSHSSVQAKPVSTFAGDKIFSARSRYTAVLDNLHQSADYVRDQQKVLNEMVQQFQLLIGYLEQTDTSRGISTHAWSVYVMHAQVIEDCINRDFNGSPLFNLNNEQPLRIHIPVNGELEAFDLPLPSLRSIIPLGAFLHGVGGRSMPSIGLLEDCMTAITSCLLEVQLARVHISDATRETRILRDTKSVVSLERSGPVVRIEKDFSVADPMPQSRGFFGWLQGLVPWKQAA